MTTKNKHIEKWEKAQVSYLAKTQMPKSLLTENFDATSSLHEMFKRYSFVGAGKKVLDIACGNGVVGGKDARELGDFYLNERQCLYGCDLLENKFFPGEFTQCNVEDLKYEDNFFDAATCVSALDHFVNPEKVFKEAHRVLKTGGKFFIFLGLYHVEPHKVEATHLHHIYTYSVEAIQNMYEEDFTNFRAVGFREPTVNVFFFRGVK